MRLHLGPDVPVAERVLEIQHEAYAVEAAIVGRDPLPLRHETLAELQAQPLIFLGASSVGYLAAVLGYRRQGDTVDVDRLAVHPLFFGRGLASKLLREMMVRERSAERFDASARAGNRPGINMYLRNGFLIAGESEPAAEAKVLLFQRGRAARSGGAFYPHNG